DQGEARAPRPHGRGGAVAQPRRRAGRARPRARRSRRPARHRRRGRGFARGALTDEGARVTLPAFELHRASSLDEATDLLDRFGDDGIAIASGTELLLLLKLGFSAYDHLVDARAIPELAGIRLENGYLEIGA